MAVFCTHQPIAIVNRRKHVVHRHLNVDTNSKERAAIFLFELIVDAQFQNDASSYVSLMGVCSLLFQRRNMNVMRLAF